MKTMFSLGRNDYRARVSIFLITVVLIGGMVGCGGPVQYSLTISTTEGGKITTPGEGISSYDEGTEVPLVALPHAGYRFDNWTGDVATIADLNGATTTITMNSDYSITASFGEEEVVAFPDPNLDAAIREAIGKPAGPVCSSDLDRLTSLSASQKDIADLTGLEHCTGLTTLHLWDNQISDISPLVNLTSLRGLSIGDNQIGDISPLANLTNLTGLELYDNQISDISPLANLTSLTSLLLWNNQISDISPLANLTDLVWLHLWNNQISDISPLANLTSLTSLLLGNNQISDISALANLTSLIVLHLYENQINDISALANVSLIELNLNGNHISDISALANLTSLMELYLGNNQISDISPLVDNEGLSRGDEVYLQGNPLSSDSINIYIPQLEARGVVVEY